MSGEANKPLGLVDALVQSSFLVQEVIRDAARRHDLSTVQTRLLGILRDREPGILALAEYLGLDKSSVTGLVDRAEGRGLVERIARADDRRAVRVRLTEAGRELAARLGGEVGEELTTLSGGLASPQRRQLAQLLEHVVLAGNDTGRL